MEIVPANVYQYPQDALKNEMSAIEFEHVFDLYYQRVFKYICYRINNHHMAEDLCSQVFEKIIFKYHTFNPEKASFEIWLFTIARNIITDYHRSNKKHIHFSLDSILEMVSLKSSPEDEIIVKDENKELFAALNKLNPKERHIISLKFAACLKNTQIANILGISSSSVGVVLYRSLKKLHDLLDEGGNISE